MFENKALHNLCFGEKSDTQRRPRSDSINTNVSLGKSNVSFRPTFRRGTNYPRSCSASQ